MHDAYTLNSSLSTATLPADLHARAQIIAEACKKCQPTSNGWNACCPAHDDDNPSLSIAVTSDKVLLYCHTGCSIEAIVQALGITMQDLFPSKPTLQTGRKKTQKLGQLIATYDYYSTDGALLFQTCRYDPKAFRQRRPDELGGWEWTLQGVPLVLYHLPEVMAEVQAGQMIYLVEGEKDVEALRAIGVPATCNPLGAGKWEPSYSKTLRNAHVVILPDNDSKGLAHGRMVAEALSGVAATIRILDLPRLPPKGDVSDWLAAGGDLDQLKMLVNSTPFWTPNAAPADDSHTTTTLTFILQKNGKPRPVLFNVLEVLSKHEHWHDVFGYDLLANTAMLLRCPPYLADDGVAWQVRPVSDYDDAETSNWLQATYEICATTGTVAEGIQVMARRNSFHPIRDYLQSLAWDGTPRLDTWLTTYAHAPDNEYTRAVGKSTLLAAVARILRPGAKVDTVPVLENDQGTFKSTLWRILASDEWFSDSLPDLHSKDAAPALRGKWIIELGELAALQRSEVEAVKRFISATQDHYRPSYGRRAQTFKRENIFVGSTNKDTYLKDETGGRRFWPVELTGRCDIDALQRDRDMLWAEAVHRFQQGDPWHMSANLEGQAKKEQSKRLEEDPWTETVLEYVRPLDEVTTKDILQRALSLDLVHWTTPNGKRIGAILRAHGWRLQTIRDENNDPVKGFKRIIPVTSVTPVTHVVNSAGYNITPNKNNSVTSVTSVTSDSRHMKEDDGGNTVSLEEHRSSTLIYGGTGYRGYRGYRGYNSSIDTSLPEVDYCLRCQEDTPHLPLDGAPMCVWCSALEPQDVQPMPSALPCAKCGKNDRWQDDSVLRCRQCWPPQ